jgi:hypothetical protein
VVDANLGRLEKKAAANARHGSSPGSGGQTGSKLEHLNGNYSNVHIFCHIRRNLSSDRRAVDGTLPRVTKQRPNFGWHGPVSLVGGAFASRGLGATRGNMGGAQGPARRAGGCRAVICTPMTLRWLESESTPRNMPFGRGIGNYGKWQHAGF